MVLHASIIVKLFYAVLGCTEIHTGNTSLEIQEYIISNSVGEGDFDAVSIMTNEVGKKYTKIIFQKIDKINLMDIYIKLCNLKTKHHLLRTPK